MQWTSATVSLAAVWFLKRLWCICWLDFLLPTKPCDWFLFQFLPRSQANQKWCHFFLPIGSQIVQESRIFSRFTFGILLIKPGVVLLTTQVTNETNPNFPSLYARYQTLICSSTDFCRVTAPFWAKSWAIYPIDTFLLKWLSCWPKSYHKLVQTQAL